MRIQIEPKPDDGLSRRHKNILSRYSAPDKQSAKTTETHCPDRMDVIFRDNPFNRLLVLTPLAFNMHHGFFVALPVTIERTKLDPFEYQFVLDRQTQIALCDQPHSIKLNPPYICIGKLSKTDHESVSRLMIKILCAPSIGNSL
jgi:hypothetical protein